VDWASYPILEIQDAPERIDIVLINRPDLPASGAGEPRDAHGPGRHRQRHLRRDGVRLRRVPITAERVKSALGKV